MVWVSIFHLRCKKWDVCNPIPDAGWLQSKLLSNSKCLRPTRHITPERKHEWSQGGALYSPTDLHHCEYSSRNPRKNLFVETCAAVFLYKNIFIGNLFCFVFIIKNASLSFNMASLNKILVGKKIRTAMIFWKMSVLANCQQAKKKMVICRTRHFW